MTKQHSSPSKISCRQNLTRLLRGITEPAPDIREPELRRQARILSTLLIVTFLLGVVSTVVTWVDPGSTSTSRSLWIQNILLAGVATILLGGTYFLSRTKQFYAAAVITIFIVLLSTFSAAVFSPDTKMILAFSMLGGVMSGLFLRPQYTALIFLSTLVAILTLPMFVPKYPGDELLNVSFLVVTVGAIVTIGAILHNQNLEQIKGQSRELSEREEKLQVAVLNAQQANDKLGLWVNELEQTNQEMSLLSRMSEMLQLCDEPDEAFAIIGQYATQLFPENSGAVYLINPSRTFVEQVAGWGKASTQMEQHTFKLSECWALRRGQMHLMQNKLLEIPCQHVESNHQAAFSNICVPMMAHGEALGILHLVVDDETMQLTEIQQRLTKTIADHLSLAVSNVKLRETLHYQAIRDPLTRLFNRRYFMETFDRELQLAKRRESNLGLVMFDIDHFKRFNDTHGHEAGDAVLIELSKTLLKKSRNTDIACRYGGEEFILLIVDSPLDACQRLAEKLREDVANIRVPFHGDLLDPITISIGVAAFPNHGSDTGLLLRLVDTALYCAKQGGRNQVKTALL